MTMERVRLTQTGDIYFSPAWILYLNSFPPEERRSLQGQDATLTKTQYHAEVILEKEQFIGILFWWEFEELRYLEHLAIQPSLRNMGYGRRILDDFIREDARPLLLDVEPHDQPVRKRRIAFYERAGLILNDLPYFQPSMQEGQPPVQLLLMSHPARLTQDDVMQFIESCHPVIYG